MLATRLIKSLIPAALFAPLLLPHFPRQRLPRQTLPNSAVVEQFDSNGYLPLTALAKLSAQAGAPMGVEWIGPGEGRPVNRKWRHTSITSIAEGILNAQSGPWHYHAVWDHGTLLVRPVGSELDGHSAVDVALPHFAVNNERTTIASRELADSIGKYLLGQSPSKTFVWTGGFDLRVPAVNLTGSFEKTPAYKILDWIASAGAESFWLMEDLPTCRIGKTNVWCTYTYFGELRNPSQQPAWALLRWRSDPMNRLDPAVSSRWPCSRCPAELKPLRR